MRKSCRGHNILSQESSGPSVGVYSKLVRGYHQQMGIYNTLNGCMTGVLQESFDSEVKKQTSFRQSIGLMPTKRRPVYGAMKSLNISYKEPRVVASCPGNEPGLETTQLVALGMQVCSEFFSVLDYATGHQLWPPPCTCMIIPPTVSVCV